MSLLTKIKSKYTLQPLFDYIPYNKCLKISYKSKELRKKLEIDNEQYQKFYEITKIIRPSYDINKYYSYLDIKHNEKEDKTSIINKINNINEKILYGGLNEAPFNVMLIVGTKGWEYIIKYLYNIKLIIYPGLLEYLDKLDIEAQKDIYELLIRYKCNITEILFYNFFNINTMNLFIIEKIVFFLKRIFEINPDNNINNSININNIYNKNQNQIFNNNKNKIKNHKVLKISFEKCQMLSYINIIIKFFDKIDNIISLNKLKELFFDSYSFDQFQIKDILNYIATKMTSLKHLKVSNYGFINNNFDIESLFYNLNDKIEIIDLSNYCCSLNLIPILNKRFFFLKELKLSLYIYEDDVDWSFIKNSSNTLEVFEVLIKGNYKDFPLENLVDNLNKITNLTKLSIMADLKSEELITFYNKSNIEYLNISLNLPKDNRKIFEKMIYDYFTEFIKLKTLNLIINDSTAISNINICFLFPPKLTSISLSNINENNVLFILNENKKHLFKIEEFKLYNCNFCESNFNILVNLFYSFKSLKKLFLNKLKHPLSKFPEFIFYFLPRIFQILPSILEIDISNNEYEEKIFKKEIFEYIRLSIPKKLLSLKIFNNQIPISYDTFIYLKEIFGLVLDLENNYPVIVYNAKDNIFHQQYIYTNNDFYY